jgi:hypothetical protein
MKKFHFLFISLVVLCLASGLSAQNVAINADASTADPSAILDVKSTTTGFLPPRMTTEQMNAISSPAEGLMVYNTNLKCPMYYTGTK